MDSDGVVAAPFDARDRFLLMLVERVGEIERMMHEMQQHQREMSGHMRQLLELTAVEHVRATLITSVELHAIQALFLKHVVPVMPLVSLRMKKTPDGVAVFMQTQCKHKFDAIREALDPVISIQCGMRVSAWQIGDDDDCDYDCDCDTFMMWTV